MSRKILRGILLKAIYPVLMLFGAGDYKEKLQGFVIKLNNKLVLGEKPKVSRVLILLPHCLQIDDCKIRLTHNIRNCAGCGRCAIKDLIAMSDDLGIDLFVATGGTLARKIVMETRPNAIVAVACERDLSSGIADIYPMPVLGIQNERPFGPCLNTKVNIEYIREAIRFFTGK